MWQLASGDAHSAPNWSLSLVTGHTFRPTDPIPDVACINRPNVARFFADHIQGGDAALAFSLISVGRSNLT